MVAQGYRLVSKLAKNHFNFYAFLNIKRIQIIFFGDNWFMNFLKKLVTYFFIVTCFVQTLHTKTEKTFLLPRSHGINLPLEYTAWNEFLSRNTEDQFGTNFAVTPFYQASVNTNDLGRYFGVQHKHTFSLHSGTGGDVRGTYLIHDAATAQAGDINLATIELSPKQKATGLRFDYFQNLEKIMSNLFVKVNVTIVDERNDLQLHIKQGSQQSKFLEYFKGNISADANSNGIFSGNASSSAQEKLRRATIDKHNQTTGVADIDALFGYTLCKNNSFNAAIHIGLSIPTSNEPNGVKVFEPIIGNANHWATVAEGRGHVTLWRRRSHNLKFNVVLQGRYLFDSVQKRTLKIKNHPYSQYYLIGELGKPRNSSIFFPAANFLTRNVDVSPGGQIDSMVGFSYNHAEFTLDAGYNFFWKNKESISLKDQWIDNKYGILYPEQELGDAANFALNEATNNAGAAIPGGAQQIINSQDLDLEAASTPSLGTHTIYAGLGYLFLDARHPILLGIGTSYEFADQYAPENWQIWCKLGVTF